MRTKAFFLQRLNDHVQYLKKIEATLAGDGDFEGTDQHSCKLGHWIDGEGPAEVGALSDPAAMAVFESVKEPHERFHSAGRRAVELKRAGDAAAARQASTEMHLLSARICRILLDLDGMK